MSPADVVKQSHGVKNAKAFHDMHGTHTFHLFGKNGNILFKLKCKQWQKNFDSFSKLLNKSLNK